MKQHSAKKILIVESFILLFLWLTSPEAIALEAGASFLSSDWEVTYSGDTICADCLAGRAFNFEAKSVGASQEVSFTVDSFIKSVSEIKVYKSLVTVTGELLYGGESTTVYDLGRNLEVTEFYSYRLHTSDDGRYFIYRKWFPRFGDDSDVVMMFDMEQASARTVDYSQYADPSDIGNPVFPAQSLQVGPAVQYLSAGGVFLDAISISSEHRAVAFMALDSSGNITLVHVGLWGEDDNSVTCAIPLIDYTVEAEYLSDRTRYVPESLMFTSAHSIAIKFYENRGVELAIDVNLFGNCGM